MESKIGILGRLVLGLICCLTWCGCAATWIADVIPVDTRHFYPELRRLGSLRSYPWHLEDATFTFLDPEEQWRQVAFFGGMHAAHERTRTKLYVGETRKLFANVPGAGKLTKEQALIRQVQTTDPAKRATTQPVITTHIFRHQRVRKTWVQAERKIVEEPMGEADYLWVRAEHAEVRGPHPSRYDPEFDPNETIKNVTYITDFAPGTNGPPSGLVFIVMILMPSDIPSNEETRLLDILDESVRNVVFHR